LKVKRGCALKHSGVLSVISVFALAGTARAASTLCAATSLGPFKSADSGVTWNQLIVTTNDSSLPGVPKIFAIVVDPQTPSTVYAIGRFDSASGFADLAGSQVVATHRDYSLAGKAGTFADAATVPAKPGKVIILWATGLGPTMPAAPSGAALAPGSAGLYQIAIQVPNTLADGDWPIQASIGGALSPTGIVLSIAH
jgi:uncharacterized protein (TIGR03437 family)